MWHHRQGCARVQLDERGLEPKATIEEHRVLIARVLKRPRDQIEDNAKNG